jgi:hypothetical protein
MNAEELRALQAPLKARYREDAASARLVSRAEAVLLAERPSCRWPAATAARPARSTCCCKPWWPAPA